VNYVYGQDGQRAAKYTAQSETLYFNKMWTLHTDGGNSHLGGEYAKNVYLGETRIVTKLVSANEIRAWEEVNKIYFYHSDHLGSASLITDENGNEYQRLEYTPYGEVWVDKYSQIQESTALLPYKFTGKERDEETGLYYYGARYLDPMYSIWISPDPALGDYLPTAGADNSSLSGMGGVFNSVNMQLYHYAGNNPVRYSDPDGCIPIDTVWDIGCTIFDTGVAIYKSSKGDNSGWVDVGIDAAAILIPYVPAGLSKIDEAVKLARKADKIGDTVRAADKAGDAAKFAKTASSTESGGVKMSRSKYPESVKYIEDAIKNGQPEVLTLDRAGAKANRRASLKGHEKIPNLDLDEYPPAMSKEGGIGADIRGINRSDNRGSGSSAGHQLRNYPDGTKFHYEITD